MTNRNIIYRVLILILTFLLSGTVYSDEQSVKLEDPDWIKEIINIPIVYHVKKMEQVAVQKNLIYKRIGDTELMMDIYSSNLQKGVNRPAVILIHGGPVPANLLTTPKNWGVFVSYGRLLASSGFIAITFNHRFYDYNSYIIAHCDITDLIAYLRGNAESLGIDKDRIILWVYSGGGPLIGPILSDNLAYIRAVVLYYALLDLQNLREFIPDAMTDEMLREYSPLFHMSSEGKVFAPIFIARAGLDNPGINLSIDRFIQEALSKNVTIDFSNHAQGQHSFDILDNNDRSREIIKRTINFIKVHSM